MNSTKGHSDSNELKKNVCFVKMYLLSFCSGLLFSGGTHLLKICTETQLGGGGGLIHLTKDPVTRHH